MKKRTGQDLLIFLALTLIGFAVYAGALGGAFVFDDALYVVKNPWVASLENLLDFTPLRYAGDASFALNRALLGDGPSGFRFVNVMIHVICSVVVFSLVRLIFSIIAGRGRFRDAPDGTAPALLASVLFLVHPVNTQAVTYISQRYTSLAALFYLLSVFLYLRARTSGGKVREGGGAALPAYAASVVVALLAMKTKEISFTLPFAILLFEVGVLGGGRAALRLLVPFFLVSLVIPYGLLGAEVDVDGALNRADEFMRLKKLEDLGSISRYEYLITEGAVVLTYLRLIVAPYAQRFDYNRPLEESLLDPGVLLSNAAVLGLIAVSVWFLVRSLRRGEGGGYGIIAATGGVWFFLTLAVESSVIPIQDPINEHRVYLPLFGAVLFFTSALSSLRPILAARGLRAGAMLIAACLLVAIPLSYATVKRNALWADDLALYLREVELNPGEPAPRLYAGRAYASRGMHGEAAAEFERAVELKPDHATARSNLAHTYMRLGRVDDAIGQFVAMKRLDPERVSPHFNLGVLYVKKGDLEAAKAEFSEALRLEPDNDGARTLLGYLMAGMEEKIIVR